MSCPLELAARAADDAQVGITPPSVRRPCAAIRGTGNRSLEAVDQLPEYLDLEHLVRQGSGTLARFEQAGDSVAELDRLAHIRGQHVDLGYVAIIDSKVEALSRFCAYEDADALNNLRSLGKLGPWSGRWLAIVRANGCELRWRTIEDQTDNYARLRPQMVTA